MKRTKSGAAVVGAKRSRATRVDLMAALVQSNREHETKDKLIKELTASLYAEQRERSVLRNTNAELSRQLREAERELSWIHRHATAKTIGAKRSFDGFQIDIVDTDWPAAERAAAAMTATTDASDHINRR